VADRSLLQEPEGQRTDDLHPLVREARGNLIEAIVGQSPVGVGLFDANARYLGGNPALQTIIGRSEPDLIGLHIDEALPGKLGVAAGRRLRDVLATGRPVLNAELTGGAPSADDRVLQVSYFRLEDESGEVLGAASLVSDVTAHRATRRALQAANARLRLLGRAARALSASLDIAQTLRSYADLVVPTFADHCIVDLIDETGTLRRAALISASETQPDTPAWSAIGEAMTYPPAHPVARVLVTGTATITEVEPEDFDYESIAPSGRSAGYARAVGVRSILVVPLLARGELLGVATFVHSASGRHYGADDLALAVQLADRAALAIDNALMFGREQNRALVLQRSLLPARLPQVQGLQAAARYLPAGLGEQVGGDWYDVIPLRSGRIAVVIGDVMGRGIPAAALMGQVRAAVRGYAVQDLPPADVLTYADELVRGLDEITIVTCVYAVYDPADARLELANAGHVPPLLVGALGAGPASRRLDASGPPLGAGGLEPYEQVSLDFHSHQALVLYTDGLVETRDSDVEDGIQALRETLGSAVVDLDRVCDAVLAALGREQANDDDLAILVVRPDERARPRVAFLPLLPEPQVVGRAREFTMRTLRSWDVAEDDIDLATLVVSELATNGLRYSGSGLSLHLALRPDSLYLEVRDDSPALPQGRRPKLDSEGGRGLLLVGSLAEAWGARRVHAGGKAVWCRLRRTAGPVVRRSGRQGAPNV
jgi:PAS domain S-box-containing protein